MGKVSWMPRMLSKPWMANVCRTTRSRFRRPYLAQVKVVVKVKRMIEIAAKSVVEEVAPENIEVGVLTRHRKDIKAHLATEGPEVGVETRLEVEAEAGKTTEVAGSSAQPPLL